MSDRDFCNSYKAGLLEDTRGDRYMIALYTADADLSKDTLAYSPEHEVEGQGYEAGGKPLGGFAVTLDGDAAVLDFDDPIWAKASITARKGLIYNASRGNRAVRVMDFGDEVRSTNGPFTVFFPPPTAATGLVVIGKPIEADESASAQP